MFISAIFWLLASFNPAFADNPPSGCECALSECGSRKVIEWTRDSSRVDELRSHWNPNNFTDPKNFDVNNFKFVVKAIQEAPSRHENLSQLWKTLEMDDVSSASFVSNEFYGTYGPWGLVLEIPPESIISTAPFDMIYANRRNTNIVTDPKISFERFGFHTPYSLMRETIRGRDLVKYDEWKMGQIRYGRLPEGDPVFSAEPLNAGGPVDFSNCNQSGYNEIKFKARIDIHNSLERNRSPRGENVAKVMGVFFNPHFQDRAWKSWDHGDPAEFAAVKQLARQLNVPLVIFSKPVEFRQLGRSAHGP